MGYSEERDTNHVSMLLGTSNWKDMKKPTSSLWREPTIEHTMSYPLEISNLNLCWYGLLYGFSFEPLNIILSASMPRNRATHQIWYKTQSCTQKEVRYISVSKSSMKVSEISPTFVYRDKIYDFSTVSQQLCLSFIPLRIMGLSCKYVPRVMRSISCISWVSFITALSSEAGSYESLV